MAQNEIRWSAPEFTYYEKGRAWQAGVAVVAVLIATIAFFQKNFLFAIFAIGGGFLVAFWGNRRPETLAFTLSEKGLDIHGKKFYPFETLTGFTIAELDGGADVVQELVIRMKSSINPYLKILIGNGRGEEFRAYLAPHLPEIEYQEGLVDWIAKLLRF